jgi:hypothetical protein
MLASMAMITPCARAARERVSKMTTVYIRVNRQILHEKRDGRKACSRPATLGHVIATVFIWDGADYLGEEN